MTLPGTWILSLIDDSLDASQRRLRQIPPTPIEFTDSFYDMEGNIIVQKTDVEDNSINSNNSSTSSGSRGRSYRSRTRKEKQKKCHGSKISWWDDSVMNYVDSEPNPQFPSHPDIVKPNGPVDNLES